MITDKLLATRRCLLGILLAILSTTSVSAKSYWLGDVDGDGKVTIRDLVLLNRMLHEKMQTVKAADANRDGKVDKADIQTVVDIILGKIAKTEIKDSGFADGDQKDPDGSGASGGYTDGEQGNPNIGEGGGFRDDDMKDPQ